MTFYGFDEDGVRATIYEWVHNRLSRDRIESAREATRRVERLNPYVKKKGRKGIKKKKQV